jgi:hypothetical protein
MLEELITNAIMADRDRASAQLQLSREALRFKKSRTRPRSGRPSLAWPRPLAWLRFSRS